MPLPQNCLQTFSVSVMLFFWNIAMFGFNWLVFDLTNPLIKQFFRVVSCCIPTYLVISTIYLLCSPFSFEIHLNGRTYFAFQLSRQTKPKIWTSYCDHTFNGWVHDEVVNHEYPPKNWACYYGMYSEFYFYL